MSQGLSFGVSWLAVKKIRRTDSAGLVCRSVSHHLPYRPCTFLLHAPTPLPATNSPRRFGKEFTHTFSFWTLRTPTIDMPSPGPNMASASPKDDSLRFRTTISNALTDQLPTLHDRRGLAFRSLSPLRTQEEVRQEHEFLASLLREAMSIIEDEINDYEGDDTDDSADDDDGNAGRGASSNYSYYGDRKQ
jgi:hypothetical protein